MQVSVVIPAYNSARTIEGAVASVLAQDHPVLEVLVVDDGSRDDTAAIVEAFPDERVRCLRRPNGGAGAARNTGLDAARGDWVAFLDADDYWRTSRVRAAAEALARDPSIEFQQSNRVHVEVDGRVDGGLQRAPAAMTDRIGLLGGFLIKTSAVMIRRSLLERLSLRFPTDQRTCEDYHLFWRAVMGATAIGYTAAPEVVIRQTPDSLSRGNADALLERDNIKTLVEVHAWAREHGVDPAYRSALQDHLRWQLRNHLATLLRHRDLAGLRRYGGIALREVGPLGTGRALVSALRSLRQPGLPQADATG